MLKASSLYVAEPQLPRKRKVPTHVEVGSGETHSYQTVEEFYHSCVLF